MIPPTPVSDKLKEQVLREINNLVKDVDFYQKDAFAGLVLSEETSKLSEKN